MFDITAVVGLQASAPLEERAGEAGRPLERMPEVTQSAAKLKYNTVGAELSSLRHSELIRVVLLYSNGNCNVNWFGCNNVKYKFDTAITR